MVTSPDFPVMAMLRAPKLWLHPNPTPLPTQANRVKGQSEAVASANSEANSEAVASVPPSPASDTEAVPQDPIYPEMHSLPLSSGPTGQGREATPPTVSGHRAGSAIAPLQTATDTQASPNSPRADLGEIGGTSPPGPSKAEHPRSSPQAAVDKNMAEDLAATEKAPLLALRPPRTRHRARGPHCTVKGWTPTPHLHPRVFLESS